MAGEFDTSQLNKLIDPYYVEKFTEGVLDKSIIDYLDVAIKKSEFYQNILSYFTTILASAIFVWGLFYFIKAFWDMLRGQESWDEFFAFIVKKSIPVIVIFLFTWPINLPPLLETGDTPFGIYFVELGEKAAFNVPKMLWGNDTRIEVMPLVMVKNTVLYEKVKKEMSDGTKVKNTAPEEANKLSFLDLIKDPFRVFGYIVNSISLVFVQVLLDMGSKLGFVIMFFTVFVLYLIQMVFIKLRFIFFEPLFYLTTVFLFFDKYRDNFYENIKSLFAWTLQPTFVVLTMYATLQVGFYVLLLFTSSNSILKDIFVAFMSYSGVGWNVGKAILLTVINVVLLIIMVKLALGLPSRVAAEVFGGLKRLVSLAFRITTVE